MLKLRLDSLTFPLMWLGLLDHSAPFSSLHDAVLGACIVYLSYGPVVGCCSRVLTGKKEEESGYGDFKLLAALESLAGMGKIFH